jgi:hypothetical protein
MTSINDLCEVRIVRALALGESAMLPMFLQQLTHHYEVLRQNIDDEQNRHEFQGRLKALITELANLFSNQGPDQAELPAVAAAMAANAILAFEQYINGEIVAGGDVGGNSREGAATVAAAIGAWTQAAQIHAHASTALREHSPAKSGLFTGSIDDEFFRRLAQDQGVQMELRLRKKYYEACANAFLAEAEAWRYLAR